MLHKRIRNYTLGFFKLITFLIFILLFLRGILPELFTLAPVKTKTDFSFKDVSESAGINFTHAQNPVENSMTNIAPWFESQGSSASVADVDNDGYQDIFLATSKSGEKNKLFINQKNGTFIDKAKEYSLDSLGINSIAFRTLFFDCDNDGQQELLVLSFDVPVLLKKDSNFSKYKPIAFSHSRLPNNLPIISANIFDYNHDGLLDIIFAGAVGNGMSQDSSSLPSNFINANNGAKTFIFKNTGKCLFEPVNILSRQSELLFTNAIGVGDFKGLRKRDIWFATDFHQDEVYSPQDKDAYFNDKSIAPSLVRSGMSVEHAFLEDPIVPYVFISHVYKQGYMPFGNALYHFENGTFKDYGLKKGVNKCGWAWGAKFFDINNDGYQDLYVTNGFFSSKSQKEQSEYWYYFGMIGSSQSNKILNPNAWPPMKDIGFAGNERDCLFLNHNNKNFENIDDSEDIKLDTKHLNGRAVATIDFKNNGSIGLLVTNQHSKTYLYDTIQHNSNHWIGFKLHGTVSNRDAIGAQVRILTAHTNLPALARELSPFNGYVSQSDSRIHFGLGDYIGSISAEIIWPSGIRQLLKNLSPDRYYEIKEVKIE